MSIYERPTKSLMADWAREHLARGQTFNRAAAVQWFAEKYPKIKPATVKVHVDVMSVNYLGRRNHPSTKPGSGHDLFWKLGSDQFRLWVPESDPPPRYKEDIEKQGLGDAENVAADGETEDESSVEAEGSFALEQHLQSYLVRNLGVIEPGLRLYEDEGITGIEFPVGGRFIDILATDKDGRLVVIELKVSRGYDRVVGQLLRYMGWVDENMKPSQPVRGIIVAKEITADLKLATSRVPDVRLIEYEIDFKLHPV